MAPYRWLNNYEIAEPPQWLLDLVIVTTRDANGRDRGQSSPTPLEDLAAMAKALTLFLADIARSDDIN